MISNLESATEHINNIAHSLDNPQTLSELKQTVSNAALLTATFNKVGNDIRKIMSDSEFMNGLRKLSIGLGEFLGEIYPIEPHR